MKFDHREDEEKKVTKYDGKGAKRSSKSNAMAIIAFFSLLKLESVVRPSHFNSPSEFFTMRFGENFFDGYIIFFAPVVYRTRKEHKNIM